MSDSEQNRSSDSGSDSEEPSLERLYGEKLLEIKQLADKLKAFAESCSDTDDKTKLLEIHDKIIQNLNLKLQTLTGSNVYLNIVKLMQEINISASANARNRGTTLPGEVIRNLAARKELFSCIYEAISGDLNLEAETAYVEMLTEALAGI